MEHVMHRGVTVGLLVALVVIQWYSTYAYVHDTGIQTCINLISTHSALPLRPFRLAFHQQAK